MLQEDKLVFIVSQPRAGSTLLQAVLSNHSKVDTTSEHWMLLQFAAFIKPSLLNADFDMITCNDAFRDFLNKRDLKIEFKKDLKSFLLGYYESVQQNSNNLIIDKTPRYYEILPEILELFPNAKIILLVRNPLATLASMIKTWQRHDMYSLSLHHRRDIFHAPFLIHEFYTKHASDKRVKKITYEDLLDTPKNVISELCVWLGIQYTPEMLNYADNPKFRGKYGDPVGVNKKTKLSTDSMGNPLNSQRDYITNDKFLNGYAHYLGAAFLEAYGNYSASKAKPSLKFKLFKLYCEYFTLFEKYNVKRMFAIITKYSVLRLFVNLSKKK